jgi:formylglycine-generating enzyme required for sulfatase activity
VVVEDGCLTLGEGFPITGIAWKSEFPKTDYELCLEVKRIDGNDTFCGIVFPVGQQHLAVNVGGWRGDWVGLEYIDGKGCGETGFKARVPFQAQKFYQVRLRVTQEAIQLWVEGEEVIKCTDIAKKQFSVYGPWTPLMPFGLHSWGTKSGIRSIRLRRLSTDAPPGNAVPWKLYPSWPFDAAEAKRRQEETAKALGVKVDGDADLGNGVKLTLVLIPAGEFMMSSPFTEEGRGADEREHKVKIREPFWIGKYEVTQEQWQGTMGYNRSSTRGPRNPVDSISWDEAQEFLRKLNGSVPGGRFALPTEAQWEYACRAGTDTPFSFGATITSVQVNCRGLGASREGTAPVGSLPANPWGLHEMHGNAWEWCASPYSERYDGSEEKGAEAPGPFRCYRSGSWHHMPRACRSAARISTVPTTNFGDLGFRPVRSIARGN